MDATSRDLLHGTLDSLILKTLARRDLHGYGIARWLEQATGDAIRVEEGSLYPALYRLQKRGWIASTWGKSELGRRAKFYRLTRTGRRQLDVATDRWREFSAAVSKVLLSDGAVS